MAGRDDRVETYVIGDFAKAIEKLLLVQEYLLLLEFRSENIFLVLVYSFYFEKQTTLMFTQKNPCRNCRGSLLYI